MSNYVYGHFVSVYWVGIGPIAIVDARLYQRPSRYSLRRLAKLANDRRCIVHLHWDGWTFFWPKRYSEKVSPEYSLEKENS